MKIKGIYILIAIFTLATAITVIASSTTRESNKNEIVKISFADTMDIDEIKKLDGQLVRIIGFMATTSPLDGSFFYLQNMPYQSCPFCIPNTNTLANTIAVYAPEGRSFRFQDIPLQVTGRIKVEDVNDDLGYFYSYRIADAEIEKAEVSGLGREIRIYTELIDQGFATVFTSAIEDLYIAINYKEFDISEEDVEPLSKEKIQELKAMFNTLNRSDYEDIYQVVESLDEIFKDVNMMIENRDFDNLKNLNQIGMEIYNRFYLWLVKPSI